MKVKSESEVTHSCPTLSDPMDCSLPGSSVHGISQARVLEWGAIAFSENGPRHTFLDCDDIAILDCISSKCNFYVFSGTLKKPARDAFRSLCGIYYAAGIWVARDSMSLYMWVLPLIYLYNSLLLLFFYKSFVNFLNM